MAMSAAAPAVPSAAGDTGSGLSLADRAFFEPRFGRDLSAVRIHADEAAARSTRALAAQAYTVGNDIWFGAGRYRPGTSEGRRLLAHELTHVVQQDAAPALGDRGADGPATDGNATGDRTIALVGARTGGLRLQRNPDVDFVVHGITAARDGRLADPDQTDPGMVTWAVDFGVTAPLDASADVEVTGAAGDDCTAHTVGFMQTVHSQSLVFEYLGRSPGDGSVTVNWTVDLPIRDGDPGNMWYEPTANATATACNQHVTPRIGDYPTIQGLPKRRTNGSTGRDNFLHSVRRTMGFATTLVAAHGTTVRPLRNFLWSYNMAITFTADPANVDDPWPFNWITNSTRVLDPNPGASTVPLFADTSATYNQSLVENVTEKS
jgi:hypothetical protein